MIYEFKHRRPIGSRFLKSNATKVWKNLLQIVTQQSNQGEFKLNFTNSKRKNSTKDNTFNFAPTMSA